MTKTEKLLAVAFGVVSGIALAYIQKSKRLERLNGIQAETIKELREYIEWTERYIKEDDRCEEYLRRCDE